MSDFKLLDPITEEDRFSTDKGTFVVYSVAFEGSQGSGTARHKRKDSSPAPVAGEVIDAEIKHGRDGPELKRIYKPGGGGSSNGGGRAKPGEFRTPEQIIRSDAHGKAMHWMDIKVAAGEWQPISWEQYIAMVDRYYDDIKGAS